MSVSGHPDWKAYKAALARMAEASTRLLEHDPSSPGHEEAEREFQEAMWAYDEVRSRLNKPGGAGG